MSDHIAEWYCRWVHPERVGIFLDTLAETDVVWGSVRIDAAIQRVCESHGWDAGTVRKDDLLKTDFLAGTEDDDEADLRFCAVLLRLADILDFDNTRTPAAIYDYAGLDEPESPQEEASAAEWQKHMAAVGFRFPRGKRGGAYPLAFVAVPKEPGVEYGVRRFLTVIDNEVLQCASVIGACSPRWDDFPLPDKIDRSNIKSDGYKYGEHRFTLDKDQVLELLMGEALYSNRYVFIRELLQNALDASRHREFYEHSIGNVDFKAKAVNVTTWHDDEGCQWVRVDDYGMGMDEEIIEKFLLKVGKSYYNSPEFDADVLQYAEKVGRKFVPISRFGIGILACFIAGDRVEVNTRRVSPSGGQSPGIRLSVSSARQFYTMCLDDATYAPAPMPAEQRPEDGYRGVHDCGTSVAVRLDPVKDDGSLHVREELEWIVAYPTVPVYFGAERVGGDYVDAMCEPWSETLSDVHVAELSQGLGFVLSGPVEVHAVPLDISLVSTDPDLRGQVVVVCVHLTPEDRAGLGSGGKGPTIQVDLDLASGQARVEARSHGIIEDPARGPQGFGFARVSVASARASHEAALVAVRRDARISWLSHNGLRVPPPGIAGWRGLQELLRLPMPEGHYCAVGHVALSDGLRPDVSLSRREFRSFSWRACASLNLAVWKALAGTPADAGQAQYAANGPRLAPNGTPSLGQLLADEATDPTCVEWLQRAIIPTSRGPQTVASIRAAARPDSPVCIGLSFPVTEYAYMRTGDGPGVLQLRAATLAQCGLSVSLQVHGKGAHGARLIVASGVQPPAPRAGTLLFPPLFFVPYDGSETLKVGAFPLNLGHSFSAWLTEAAPQLAERCPALLAALRAGLCNDALVMRWNGSATQRVVVLRRLNDTLRRLRLILALEHAPPARLVLTDDDFIT